MPACPACPACPVAQGDGTGVAPGDGTGIGPEDRTGAVIFFACLDLEQKSSFMDGH